MAQHDKPSWPTKQRIVEQPPKSIVPTTANKGLTTPGLIKTPYTVLDMPTDGALTTALFDPTYPVPAFYSNYPIARADRVAAAPEHREAPARGRAKGGHVRENERRRVEQRDAAAEDDRNAPAARDVHVRPNVRAAAAAPPAAAIARAHEDVDAGPRHVNEEARRFWQIIAKFGGINGVSTESLNRIVNKGLEGGERDLFRAQYAYWFNHLLSIINADNFLEGTDARKVVRRYAIISYTIFQGWQIYYNLSNDMELLSSVVDMGAYFDVHIAIAEDLRKDCSDGLKG